MEHLTGLVMIFGIGITLLIVVGFVFVFQELQYIRELVSALKESQ